MENLSSVIPNKGMLSELYDEYDVVILGGGPAGLTSAIYSSRANLKTLLIEKATIGGEAAITDLIENYPGFPEGINGFELAERMRDQAEKFGTKIIYSLPKSLDLKSQPKVIHFNKTDVKIGFL